MNTFFKNMILIFFFMFFQANAPLYSVTDSDYFMKIKGIVQNRNYNQLKQEAESFFKKFPGSRYIPEIRLILADNNISPYNSLQQFRIIVDKYRFYPKRDYAQYRICEILYLQDKTDFLLEESLKGIKLFPDSIFLVKFKIFYAKANLKKNRLHIVQKTCNDITKHHHDYENLAESLLLKIYTEKNIYGNSQRYIRYLKDLILGFKNSDKLPAAIYLLGRFYESKGDYDRAWSAYNDVMKNYPKSFESFYALRRIPGIKKHNPRTVNYIPDLKVIKESDSIEIHPDIEISGENEKGKTFYSVSFGPFYNLENAEKIKKLIIHEYSPVKIIRLRRNFVIYAGHTSKPRTAVSMKIRLAEEYGLNGKIVRIIRDSNKQYIYGD